jgi:glucuronoarabinoxylan endo-1,4-beta-xylanase
LYPNTIKRISLGSFLVFVLLVAGCSKKDTVNGPFDGTGTASVNLTSTQQVIRGFGAANILPWRPDMTADEINTAFGTGTGQLGFSILRLRVPPDTSEFAIQVATAQKASSLGAMVFASPWTPPASMKTNTNTVGGALKTDSYAAFATYLKSFADYMSSNGVPLYAISVQNEPDVTVTYESCYWNASQMLAFVRDNAPSVGVRIIADEASGFNHTITDAILNDPIGAANLSIVGGHLYGATPQSYPLAKSKGKDVWMTEYLDLDTTWSHVLATGKQIHDCMNAGMNAYVWWYIVRFYGPILEDGSVSKRGYVMSQYARFIRPGYTRVDATANPQAGVYVTAYTNGTKVVIVAVNNGSSIQQPFSIQNGSVSTVTPYATSSSQNCTQGGNIAVSNGAFTATLDSSSITTFVSN